MAIDALPDIVREAMGKLPPPTTISFVGSSDCPHAVPPMDTEPQHEPYLSPFSFVRSALRRVTDSRPALFTTGTIGYHAWRRWRSTTQ